MSAAGIALQLQGLSELRAKLKRVATKDANKAIRKGTRASAKITTAAAKPAVPVVSGLWRQQIKTRAMKRRRGFIGARTTVGAKGWYAGEAFYAAFVEFGHKIGKRPSEKLIGTAADTRKQIEGKHYMERSVKHVADRAGQTCVDTIKSELETLAAR